jgi:hypothetical protein
VGGGFAAPSLELSTSIAFDSSIASGTVEAVTAGQSVGGNIAASTVTEVTGVTANATLTAVANIAAVVGIVLTVYTIMNFVYNALYGCKNDDMMTSSKLGFDLCHEVTTWQKGAFGLSKTRVYCCFNSILSKIINEQGRPQIGKSWGNFMGGDDCDRTYERVDCNGFTPAEVSSLDFSQMDLSEYMQYIEQILPVQPDQGTLKSNFQQKFNNMSGTTSVGGSSGGCTPSSVSVQPYTVEKTVVVGSSAVSSQLLITDNCGQGVQFVSSVNAAWMSFPSSGTGAGTLTFSTEGLAVGSYTGTVTISSSGYSTVSVPITLTITGAAP